MSANVGADKSETKTAVREASQCLNWNKDRLEEWRELVADKALVEDLTDLIHNPADAVSIPAMAGISKT